MRRMKTSQATKWTAALLSLLIFITACSPSEPPVLTSTPQPTQPTSQLIATFTPAPSPTATVSPTATPLTCLSQPGRVESGIVESTNPPQEYFIYLPPCYDELTDSRYPVLYLLHGQTYTADQWLRLGAAEVLDNLILSGASQPFIIVFPDDRFWNLEAGPGFGDRLINALIPHIDETYRTRPQRDQRAIGGLSRGAGWALQLGLTRWDLFSVIGLHSPAVFQGDASKIERWLKAMPVSAQPTIYMDIGDNDQELVSAGRVEALLTAYGVPHTWQLYSGAHTEEYWSAHVEEYIAWYAEQLAPPLFSP